LILTSKVLTKTSDSTSSVAGRASGIEVHTGRHARDQRSRSNRFNHTKKYWAFGADTLQRMVWFLAAVSDDYVEGVSGR